MTKTPGRCANRPRPHSVPTSRQPFTAAMPARFTDYRKQAMNLHLQNNVVIVTGGGSGIGAAISMTLAEEGAIPVIISNTEPTHELMHQLHQHQPQARFILAELRDESSCVAAVKQVLTRYGSIDGLVNNAGANDS